MFGTVISSLKYVWASVWLLMSKCLRLFLGCANLISQFVRVRQKILQAYVLPLNVSVHCKKTTCITSRDWQCILIILAIVGVFLELSIQFLYYCWIILRVESQTIRNSPLVLLYPCVKPTQLNPILLLSFRFQYW